MSQRTSLEWAALIPSNWRVVPLKHVCRFTTGWTPPTGDGAAYAGDNFWANISDIGPKVINETAKRLSDDAIERHNIAPSPAGSLLFSFKLSIGQVSFAGTDMFTNEAIATFLPNNAIDLNFAYYAFPEMIVRNASENIYGAKMLNQQLIKSATLVLPPLSEQTAIATFLDRETTKIDALVEEQKRLIELLKEKRLAVISHAVTKGLDPNVRMKPSGVEWLGDVPEHWEVLAVKRVAAVFVPQRNKPELNSEADGLPWVTMENMDSEEIFTSDSHVSTDSALSAGSRVLVAGSVVASCVGNFGVASITRSDVIINQQLQAYLPGVRILADFLRLAVIAGQSYFEQVGTAATLVYVNQEGFANFRIAVPPTQEQRLIALEVMKITGEVAALIRESQEAINLLLERRAALISAAVTGKINVTMSYSAGEKAA